MSAIQEIIREEARLIILKELAQQPDGRLNSSLLVAVLQSFGIHKPRDWVNAELRWLETVGAVTVSALGSVLIGALTPRGLDHVERRIILDGVKRPNLSE